jgi:hypothetical protein
VDTVVSEKELNEFASFINECRKILSKNRIEEGLSLSYASTLLYSKALVTECEIFTLLKENYPHGAMALARNTYETLVILVYLNEHSSDVNLIPRFFDDNSVKACWDGIYYLNWYQKGAGATNEINEQLKQLIDKYSCYKNQYEQFLSGKGNQLYFHQYWWTNEARKSFRELEKAAGFTHNYLYDISSCYTHAGLAGTVPLDNNVDDEILLGTCSGGKKLPLLFSILNLRSISVIYFSIHHMNCDDLIIRMDSFTQEISHME